MHLCSGLSRTPYPGLWCCTRSALRSQTQKNQSCSCSVGEATVSLLGPTLIVSLWVWTWHQRFIKVTWETLKLNSSLSDELTCPVHYIKYFLLNKFLFSIEPFLLKCVQYFSIIIKENYIHLEAQQSKKYIMIREFGFLEDFLSTKLHWITLNLHKKKTTHRKLM